MPTGIYDHKNTKTPIYTVERNLKVAKSHLGKKQTSEQIRKRSISHILGGKNRGSNHYNWKGGVTPINNRIRKSKEFKLWREAVFKRDNYTCIWCGVRGGVLHPDHIKPFCLYPELRFAIDNGRTLCIDCHKKTSTWGVKKVVK
jgi:5-methylcytosine-specific restriction endonuclease McrA